MGRIRSELWMTAAVIICSWTFTAWILLRRPTPMSLIFLAIMSGLLWWMWPGRIGKHTPHRALQAQATPDDVTIYWRPG